MTSDAMDGIMKQKKHVFTLMEVMIGFAIISLVLGMIFSSLYQETVLKRKIQRMTTEVMGRIQVQQFLDRIFASLAPSISEELNRSFYTLNDSEPQLLIRFENGIDSDPLFCGDIEGILRLEGTDLVFVLKGRESSTRTVVLRGGMRHLSFEFLANDTHGLKSDSMWDESHQMPPSFMKMTLNRNEDYAFWINRSEQAIPLTQIPRKDI